MYWKLGTDKKLSSVNVTPCNFIGSAGKLIVAFGVEL
uniref:Uncharacterized protein n=1 Tax=Arundo donax TaxID=35708 RepID=A0A0A9HVN8_ARUDO